MTIVKEGDIFNENMKDPLGERETHRIDTNNPPLLSPFLNGLSRTHVKIKKPNQKKNSQNVLS